MEKTPPASPLDLDVMPYKLGVFKLKPTEIIPPQIFKSSFFSITKTDEELSVVCELDFMPKKGIQEQWRMLKVRGPLDFALVGILARLSAALAKSEISLFAISTFDTDYLMVAEGKLEAAIRSLEARGNRVHR